MLQKYLLAATLLIFFLHLTGTVLYWYQTYNWFDIPMHILGGAWVAIILLYVLSGRRELLKPSKHFLVNVLLITGLVSLVGVFWEFWEYFSAAILPQVYPIFAGHAGDLSDTLLDLFDDILGGALVAGIYFWKK